MIWIFWGAMIGGIGLSVIVQEISGYAAWGWGALGAIIGGILGGFVVASRNR